MTMLVSVCPAPRALSLARAGLAARHRAPKIPEMKWAFDSKNIPQHLMTSKTKSEEMSAWFTL